MNTSQEFKCNQCLQNFTTAKLPLKMLYCFHNICQKCFDEIKNSKEDIIQCGFCGSTLVECKSKKLEINKQLLGKIISIGKKEESLNETFQNNLSHPPPLKLMSSNNFSDDMDFLLQEDHFQTKKKGGNKTEEKNLLQLEICHEHDKPLQIICLTDLKRICPHCAIFGNHRDHKFKSLKQFNEDVEQNLRTIQLIKQRKYKLDKRIKSWGYAENIKTSVKQKQRQMKEEIERKFTSLMQIIENQQKKVFEELKQYFISIEKTLVTLLKEESKIENQYLEWESDCENLLNRVHQNISLNEKITILYGPLLKISDGQKILSHIQKRAEILHLKIYEHLNTIKYDWNEKVSVPNIVTVYQVNEENKTSFPSSDNTWKTKKGTHEFGDCSDNSFIYNCSQDASSYMEDSGPKTPLKKEKTASSFLNETLKITSPDKKVGCRLGRSKSNNNFKSVLEGKKRSSKEQEIQIRDPVKAVEEFIKHDLKDVLDLSSCCLDDQKAFDYLKQARRHRRVRGLKLNRNMITDSGFLQLIELLGTTSNLNLANNQLTEESLNIIIKNKEKLGPLKIVNISGNKYNEKKAKLRVEEIKKMKIVITL